MTPSIPDAATLRALDGAALAVVALQRGLAPQGAELWPDGETVYAFGQGELWQPHLHVAQAEEVLRRLRARGWHTTHHGAPGDTGKVLAWRGLPDAGPCYGQSFGLEGEPTEAHALLLVSVLAVASSQEEAREIVLEAGEID